MSQVPYELMCNVAACNSGQVDSQFSMQRFHTDGSQC